MSDEGKQILLGLNYLHGRDGYNVDYQKAKGIFEKVIDETKDLYAYNNLGYIFMNGYGVDKNLERARDLFNIIIEKGIEDNCNKMAKYNLGITYESKNIDKAIFWQEEAYNAGYKPAINYLWRLYRTKLYDINIPRNETDVERKKIKDNSAR